ncbi:16985_t:CDS:2, partial [Racocetra persica]
LSQITTLLPIPSPTVSLNQSAVNVNTSDTTSLLNPRLYSVLIRNKTYPGTNCTYISTPQPEDNIS